MTACCICLLVALGSSLHGDAAWSDQRPPRVTVIEGIRALFDVNGAIPLITGSEGSDNAARTFSLTTIAARNAVFTRCKAVSDAPGKARGGAICASDCVVYAVDSSFGENRADCGASLAVVRSSLFVVNSLFDKDYAKVDGGSIHFVGRKGSQFFLTGSTFRNCRTKSAGGAVFCEKGSGEFADTVFEGCRGQSGGAVAITDMEAEMEQCKFMDNWVQTTDETKVSGGGAIMFLSLVKAGQLELKTTGCCFWNNLHSDAEMDVLVSGHVVYRSTGDTFRDVAKSTGVMGIGNPECGGANVCLPEIVKTEAKYVSEQVCIASKSEKAKIEEQKEGAKLLEYVAGEEALPSFVENITVEDGTKADLTWTPSGTLTGSNADRHFVRAVIQCNGCTFTKGLTKYLSAVASAGAAISARDCQVSINSGRFNYNKAILGGSLALYLCESVIQNSAFSYDSAVLSGGSIISGRVQSVVNGMLYQESSLLMTGNSFTECTTRGNGGAIMIISTNDAYMTGTTFTNCKASEAGGAITIEDALVTINQCKFLNNKVGDRTLKKDVSVSSSVFGYAATNRSEFLPHGGGAICVMSWRNNPADYQLPALMLYTVECCFVGNRVVSGKSGDIIRGRGQDLLFSGECYYSSTRDAFVNKESQAIQWQKEIQFKEGVKAELNWQSYGSKFYSEGNTSEPAIFNTACTSSVGDINQLVKDTPGPEFLTENKVTTFMTAGIKTDEGDDEILARLPPDQTRLPDRTAPMPSATPAKTVVTRALAKPASISKPLFYIPTRPPVLDFQTLPLTDGPPRIDDVATTVQGELVNGSRVPVFRRSMIVLRGCTFEMCRASGIDVGSGSGGAVHFHLCWLDARECTWKKNFAASGGAISTVQSEVVLMQCTFTNDEADFLGGSIVMMSNVIADIAGFSSSLYMNQITIKGSYSRGSAGGLFVTGMNDVYLQEVSIDGCHCAETGGAAALINSSCYLLKCKFTANVFGDRRKISRVTTEDRTGRRLRSSVKGGGALFVLSEQGNSGVVPQTVTEDCCFCGNGLYGSNPILGSGLDVLCSGNAFYQSFNDAFVNVESKAIEYADRDEGQEYRIIKDRDLFVLTAADQNYVSKCPGMSGNGNTGFTTEPVDSGISPPRVDKSFAPENDVSKPMNTPIATVRVVRASPKATLAPIKRPATPEKRTMIPSPSSSPIATQSATADPETPTESTRIPTRSSLPKDLETTMVVSWSWSDSNTETIALTPVDVGTSVTIVKSGRTVYSTIVFPGIASSISLTESELWVEWSQTVSYTELYAPTFMGVSTLVSIWIESLRIVDSPGHGLSSGQLIGIVVGCVAVVFAAIAVIIWLVRRKNNSSEAFQYSSDDSAVQETRMSGSERVTTVDFKSNDFENEVQGKGVYDDLWL